MIIEALGSAVIGFAAAWIAARLLPQRFTDLRLVLATGPVAALLGGIVTRVVLGPGEAALSLLCAAAVSVAMLSLLLAPSSRPSGLRTEMAGPPHA